MKQQAEIGTYSFKVMDSKSRGTAELILRIPGEPDGKTFDNFVELFREDFPELGKERPPEEEAEKDLEKMDQKQFEKVMKKRTGKAY